MTKTINDVIDFATNQVEVEHGTVPQDKIVAGVAGHAVKEISMQTHNHYTDPTEQFSAGFKGTWETLEAVKKIYVIWQAK